MGMICGIYQRDAGRVAGLDALLAALPAAETAVGAAWTDGAVGLGWRGDPNLRSDRPERLPRAASDAGLAVTASARLDDRASLCDALGIPHNERAGLPDGALLLRAWERWGRECPGRLLGDFAFAVWDGRRRTLSLARDAVGTRPLFYSLDADRVVFASDINSLLAAPDVSDDLDEAAVATILGRAIPYLGAHTCYRAIRRLPAGHVLSIAEGHVRLERWWRPENTPDATIRSDDAVVEEFLELHGRAVEDRMRGVSRVGVHLSGGLDSSSIAALTARARRRAGQPPPPAFAWQPPPGNGAVGANETTEHELIEAAAGACGLEVIYCPFETADALEYLRADGTRDLEIHPDEAPVRRAAAERGVRLLLSGWGGNEAVSSGGYGHEADLLREGRLVSLWRLMRERSRRPLAAIVLHAVLPLLWPAARWPLMELRAGRWPSLGPTFLHPGFGRRVRPLPGPGLPRGGMRRNQVHKLGCEHLGYRMDGWATSGARHGIEYGYPLLDRRLLEFALGLPPEQFRRGPVRRWLMRRALGGQLPAEVCRHTSGQDPLRSGTFRNALARSLPTVRSVMEARTTPPARSAYVNMPRLTAFLEPARFLASEKRSAVVNAVRFLDF